MGLGVVVVEYCFQVMEGVGGIDGQNPNNPNPQQQPNPNPNNPQKSVEVRDLVSVFKNPPYPIFYDVVAHSFALVGGAC